MTQHSLVYIIFIIFVLSPDAPHSIYTKNNFSYTYNDTYWASLSPFQPIVNSSYGSIKLGRSVRMTFQFVYHSAHYLRPSYIDIDAYFENVFRIGYHGQLINNEDGAGSRYPSMWIHYGSSGPHIIFGISHTTRPYEHYGDHRIQAETLYSVLIHFNQSHVTISLTNEHTGIESSNTTTRDGTNIKYIDEYMDVWISQFNHSVHLSAPTPPANVTLYDIVIETWDHLPTDPLPIELYEFHNQSNVELWRQHMDIYMQVIEQAVVIAVHNVSVQHPNYMDGDAVWSKGSVYQWQSCMVFNRKYPWTGSEHLSCPLVSQLYHQQFEFVAVGLMYLKSAGNVRAFREFIVNETDKVQFAENFRVILNDLAENLSDSLLFVMHGDGEQRQHRRNELRNHVIMLLGFCITLCVFLIWQYLKRRRSENRRKIQHSGYLLDTEEKNV